MAKNPGTVDIRIRRATLADARTIARLGRALNRHERDPVEHFDLAAVQRDVLRPGRRMAAIVAERKGRIVGFATFYPSYATAYAMRGLHMADLFVEAKARRLGVGRALVAAVVRIAKRRKETFVWWTSQARNRKAQRFYASLDAKAEPVMAHVVYGPAFDELAKSAARIAPLGAVRQKLRNRGIDKTEVSRATTWARRQR